MDSSCRCSILHQLFAGCGLGISQRSNCCHGRRKCQGIDGEAARDDAKCGAPRGIPEPPLCVSHAVRPPPLLIPHTLCLHPPPRKKPTRAQILCIFVRLVRMARRRVICLYGNQVSITLRRQQRQVPGDHVPHHPGAWDAGMHVGCHKSRGHDAKA